MFLVYSTRNSTKRFSSFPRPGHVYAAAADRAQHNMASASFTSNRVERGCLPSASAFRRRSANHERYGCVSNGVTFKMFTRV